MFSKQNLDLTVQRLGNIPKEQVQIYSDDLVPFNGFIQEIKKQSPEKQLKFIAEQFENHIPDLESFLFGVAAAATLRVKNLPDNHPEQKFIDTILAKLGDGLVNGFETKVLGKAVPRLGLINDIQNNLDKWLKAFEIETAGSTSHETLLVAYCTICFFEANLPDSGLLNGKRKDLAMMKQEIQQKFSQLVQENKDLISPADLSQISAVVHEITPQKKFEDKLETIAKVSRLRALDDVIGPKSKNPMVNFWRYYNTQEKFTQLMTDLELSSKEKEYWQVHFNWNVLNEVSAKVKIEAPEGLGGLPPNVFTLDKLRFKNLQAIANLGENRGNYDPSIEEVVQNIKNELGHLEEIEKRDMETIQSMHERSKSTKGISTNALGDLFKEIKEFQAYLSSQKEYLVHLNSIHSLIQQLNKSNVPTQGLVRHFEEILDQVISSLPQIDKEIPKLPREKIAYVNQLLEEAEETTKVIHADLDHLVQRMNKAAPKSSDLITAAAQFVDKHEKSFGHILLCWFSSTYKEMFESIKNGADNKDSVQIASVLVGKAEEFSKKYKVATFFKAVQDLNKLSAADQSAEENSVIDPPNQ